MFYVTEKLQFILEMYYLCKYS